MAAELSREEARAASGASTRALINERLMRSPRHGHAFTRQHAIRFGFWTCAGCKKRVWQSACRCLLCGTIIHRGCHMHASVATCESSTYTPAGPLSEKKRGLDAWDEYDSNNASRAALRYIALQRLASTAAGRVFRGVLPGSVCSVAEQRVKSSSASRDDVLEAAELIRAKNPDKGGGSNLSALYALATAAKHSRLVAERTSSSLAEMGSSRRARIGLWAGAAAAGTVAGGVVGSAVAGPAGALLGAKLAQAAVATGATASNVGALMGGAAASYGTRRLLRRSDDDPLDIAAAWARRDEAQSIAERALGRRIQDRFVAAAAVATAMAIADGLKLEFDDAANSELSARLAEVNDLETQVALFVQATLHSEDTVPGRVHATLETLVAERTIIADVGDWIRCVSIAIVAYHPLLSQAADALEATFNEVDRIVLSHSAYDKLLIAIDEPEKDAQLALAANDVTQTLAPKPNRVHFNRAVTALNTIVHQRAPNDKLKCIVVAIEELAKTPDRPNVPADLLLPLAVDAVRAVQVPNLHAHLNLIQHLGRDDFIGVQGYALTTLHCAIAVLTRNNFGDSIPSSSVRLWQ